MQLPRLPRLERPDVPSLGSGTFGTALDGANNCVRRVRLYDPLRNIEGSSILGRSPTEAVDLADGDILQGRGEDESGLLPNVEAQGVVIEA